MGTVANACHCYELVYQSVEGYAILLGRKLEVLDFADVYVALATPGWWFS